MSEKPEDNDDLALVSTTAFAVMIGIWIIIFIAWLAFQKGKRKMITQTRQGLFETNSSSTHVLTVMGGLNILEEDISLSKAPGEYQIRELYDSNWDVQDNAKTFIGIEPAAFDPDEDTKMNYNYIAEKITFLWT